MEKYQEQFITELINLMRLEGIETITTFLTGEDAILRLLVVNNIYNPQLMANGLSVSKGRISALLKEMSKKGLITFSINEEDHRKFDIKPTDKGLQHFLNKAMRAEQYFQILFEKIGLENSQKLIDMLHMINEAMKGVTV